MEKNVLYWYGLNHTAVGLSLQNFFYVAQIQLKTKTCNTICRCNEIQNKNKPPQYKLTLTMYAVNAKRTEQNSSSPNVQSTHTVCRNMPCTMLTIFS